jgi:hypothetical protein
MSAVKTMATKTILPTMEAVATVGGKPFNRRWRKFFPQNHSFCDGKNDCHRRMILFPSWVEAIFSYKNHFNLRLVGLPPYQEYILPAHKIAFLT